MTVTEGLAILCTALFYIIFLVGLILINADLLLSFYNRWRMMWRLKARRQEYKTEDALNRWLSQALLTTFGRSVPSKLFLIGVAGLFLLVFLISVNTLTLLSAFTAAAITGFLPFLLLFIRLMEVRQRGSYEGEQLVAEFLRQYRITGYNVYETIERVMDIKRDIRISSKLMFKLLLELRDTGNPIKIKKATDDFAYAINTNWSRMLAHNIYIAAYKGTNVSLAIEDILIQLREARSMVEDRKRLNSEAIRMTFYMIPVIYGTTVLMTVRYLGLPFGQFLHNQFYTEEGLILFLVIIFLFIGNTGLLSFITNQRLDY